MGNIYIMLGKKRNNRSRHASLIALRECTWPACVQTRGQTGTEQHARNKAIQHGTFPLNTDTHTHTHSPLRQSMLQERLQVCYLEMFRLSARRFDMSKEA